MKVTKMKIIKNKIIPFKGFKAINLFGIIFTRYELSEKDIQHELVHTKQMKKLWYIGFYIWYLIEYLINLIKYKDTYLAYRNISFEKEAYESNTKK